TFFSTQAHSASWTNWLTLTSNHFVHYSNGGVISVTADSDFHSCGSNNWANIKELNTNTNNFKMLNAAILSAWMTDKQVSLYIDGCDGQRANVIGVKIK
ncbi:MAG: hypothetical protein KDI92_14865, partial [Xanthomonadales bacterium]|nr:hypothetical protein [Xanthomonadales bacterium]